MSQLIDRLRKRRRGGRALGLAGLIAVGLVTSGCIWIVPASVDADGNFGSGTSQAPSLSHDGRSVAFRSTAPDLVPDDGNGVADVFVRDNLTGAIERASVDSSGVEANGASTAPHLSADGRYVAFESVATNLAPDGLSGTKVFVRDRVAGTTELVSAAGGVDPYISGDGRYVVYRAGSQVHLADRVAGIAEVVGADVAGLAVLRPSISDDGRFIAFTKQTLGPGGFVPRAYVYDRETEQSRDLTPPHPLDITQSNAASISGDGTTVVYQETVDVGTPGTGPILATFLVFTDLVTDESGRLLAPDGLDEIPPSPGPLGVAGVTISSDGERIALHTGRLLLPEDTNSHSDVYLFEKGSFPAPQLVSRNAAGELADAGAEMPSLSGDGRTIAFESAATNLAPDATSNVDVYVRGVPQPFVSHVTPSGLAVGETVEVVVHGDWFDPGAVVGVTGGGVGVDDVAFVSSEELRVTLTAATEAQLGARSLHVFNPGMSGSPLRGAIASCTDCLAVTPPPAITVDVVGQYSATGRLTAPGGQLVLEMDDIMLSFTTPGPGVTSTSIVFAAAPRTFPITFIDLSTGPFSLPLPGGAITGSEATGVIDATTSPNHISVDFEITGGTGDFAFATGLVRFEGEFVFVGGDPEDVASNGDISGTLHLPG